MSTRFYLPASGSQPVAPAFASAWTITGTAARCPLVQAATLTAASSHSVTETATGVQHILHAQYVSEPLAAQTITGNFSLCIKSNRAGANSNARTQVVVRVVDAAGTTVRGTLVAAATTYGSATYSTLLRVNSAVAIAMSGLAILDGDRLVVEVGDYNPDTSATSATTTNEIGDPLASDLVFAQGSTSGRPWVEFSNTLTFLATPGVPTSQSGTAGATDATLTWSAPATGGAPAGYHVRINGGSPIDVGNTLSYNFTGLTPGGTSYTLEVRAYNATGNSAYVSASVTTLTVPNVPTSVSTTPDFAQIDLNWAAPSGGSAVTGYDVRVNGGSPIDVGNVLTHTFTGLTPATSYTLEVRAHNAAGASAYVGGATSTLDPPDEPTSLAATPNTTGADLTWVAPAGGTAVDGYELRVDGGTPIDMGNVLLYALTGLASGTEYDVEIRSYNDGGESSWVLVTFTTLIPELSGLPLMLEVEGDPPTGKSANMLANPNGELGGAGWVTPTAGATLVEDVGNGRMLFTSGGDDVVVYFTSDSVPVTPGEFLAARWHVPTLDGAYRVIVEFGTQPTAKFADGWHSGHDLFGDDYFVQVSSETLGAPGNMTTGADRDASGVPVPDEAILARLRVEHFTNLSGSPSLAGDTMTIKHAALVATETSDPFDFGDMVEIAELEWIDVLGPTHEIESDRVALDLGTLTATILDSTLDPSVADTLATGRGCRLRAYDVTTGHWERLFTGKIDVATVTYDTKRAARRPDDPKVARISLTAHDPIAQLSASPRPDGYATIPELRAVLEGTGVPWNIEGETGQITGATVVSRNESASAVDQIAITRDSAGAYAWVDRFGVFQAWRRSVFGTVDDETVLDGTLFSDLQLSYDPRSLINSVTVVYLSYDPATQETTEVKYGPYVDAASIAARGERSAEFTVHGLVATDTDPAAAVASFAADVLYANATPARTCESLTIPIRSNEEVTPDRVLLDMYAPVEVLNASPAFTGHLHVTGVVHRISATPGKLKWFVTYTFDPVASVAAPQLTPSVPPKPTSGWTDVTFTNGWVNYGGAAQTVQYRKLGDRVEIRGAAKNGTPGTQIFQLPEGFRPPAELTLIEVSYGGALVPYPLVIRADGAMGPLAGGEDNTGVHVSCQFSTT